MRIRLADDRRTRVLSALKHYFSEHFDDPLSDFRAAALLDFMIRELGPPVYNQGVRDACRFMQDRLGDIEGEIHEPESRK